MRAPLLAVLVLGACSIGTPGVPVLPIDAPPPIDGYVCDQPTTPGPPGPTAGDDELGSAHRAGEDCMACHATGVENARIFTIAGTLYDGPSGNNPVSGATIYVHDANGAEIRMATAVNGNFFTSATVALPLMGGEMTGSKATECPKTRTMQGTALGGCNAQGCHAAAQSGTANTQGRIYLQLTP